MERERGVPFIFLAEVHMSLYSTMHDDQEARRIYQQSTERKQGRGKGSHRGGRGHEGRGRDPTPHGASGSLSGGRGGRGGRSGRSGRGGHFGEKVWPYMPIEGDISLKLVKHVNEIDTEPNMNLFMVLAPTEMTSRDCKTLEAEWVVRRGLLGKEGFCVVKDARKWHEYQRGHPIKNKSMVPKPECALFHECSVEAYLKAPLAEELRFYEQVLRGQKVYSRIRKTSEDEISDVFSSMKISTEPAEEDCDALENEFRLSFSVSRPQDYQMALFAF